VATQSQPVPSGNPDTPKSLPSGDHAHTLTRMSADESHLATGAAEFLIAAREARGLLPAEVARLSRGGFSKSQISRWEAGDRGSRLPIDKFAAWCEALGLDPAEVFRAVRLGQDYATWAASTQIRNDDDPPAVLPDDVLSRLLDGPNRPRNTKSGNHAANGM
jgi:transcriptional regulator with XRE-family HTH domain